MVNAPYSELSELLRGEHQPAKEKSHRREYGISRSCRLQTGANIKEKLLDAKATYSSIWRKKLVLAPHSSLIVLQNIKSAKKIERRNF
jgi:hypothetical protein